MYVHSYMTLDSELHLRHVSVDTYKPIQTIYAKCIHVCTCAYVTIFGKTDHLRAFCISRNTNLKYLIHCASPVAQSRQISCINSVVI